MHPDSELSSLLNTLPQIGRIEWIGARPGRGEPMVAVESAQLDAGKGMVGDRFRGRVGAARQLTLIQQEHLAVIGACLNLDAIAPAVLRRNIVVSGINLLALKDKRFCLGDAVLEFSGLAHPCSKMETALGPGGYNAMREHGGITARILEGGVVRVGARVAWVP